MALGGGAEKESERCFVRKRRRDFVLNVVWPSERLGKLDWENKSSDFLAAYGQEFFSFQKIPLGPVPHETASVHHWRELEFFFSLQHFVTAHNVSEREWNGTKKEIAFFRIVLFPRTYALQAFANEIHALAML